MALLVDRQNADEGKRVFFIECNVGLRGYVPALGECWV